MNVTLRRQVVKTCPFKNETDVGELVITIDADEAPELHELGARIDALTTEPITHEDFTREVAALVPEGSEVVTTWSTGPWAVEVRARALFRDHLH